MPRSLLLNCRWVPWAIAGAFAVVVAANGTLAYFAHRSTTGLVTEKPFNRGNGYNRVLDAAAREDALGWHGNIVLHSTLVGQRDLVFALADAAGQPLTGLKVEARVARPVEPLPPLRMLLEEMSPGRYQATVDFPKPGQWEVHVIARRNQDIFELTRRVIAQ